jgi:hypothetical protein
VLLLLVLVLLLNNRSRNDNGINIIRILQKGGKANSRHHWGYSWWWWLWWWEERPHDHANGIDGVNAWRRVIRLSKRCNLNADFNSVAVEY